MASGEPKSQESATGHDKWAWFIWAALALLLAYPLSLGPVAKVYDRTPYASVPSLVKALYAPLKIAYDRNKGVKTALDWYIGLWNASL